MDVIDADPFHMSDDELACKLGKLGFPPGPIVDSTRAVYQRKLLRLINKEDFNMSDTEGPQYEKIGDQSVVSNQSTGSTFDSSLLGNSPVVSSATAHSNMFSPQQSDAYTPGSQPSWRYDELRRRPLTRAGVSYSESPSPAVRSVNENMLHKRITAQQFETSDSSTSLSIGVKLAILVFVLIFAILVYWNMESGSSNPVPETFPHL